MEPQPLSGIYIFLSHVLLPKLSMFLYKLLANLILSNLAEKSGKKLRISAPTDLFSIPFPLPHTFNIA